MSKSMQIPVVNLPTSDTSDVHTYIPQADDVMSVDDTPEALGFAPTLAQIGPGSQPDPDAGELAYINMPTNMDTFQMPPMPEPDEVGDVSAGIALLQQCVQALQQYASSQQGQLFDLGGLNSSSLALVNQLLGIGEVSISIDGESRVMIQESVMAGLWRVQILTGERVISDAVEIAPIPQLVAERAFQHARRSVNKSEDGLPEGAINSPSVLVELADVGSQYQRGTPAHVVNLSLLPMSAEDIYVLGERLGVGPVTILSRGYGNCRIGSTACDHVWWIKYFNSEDALILNTIEVVDVPEVAQAAPEDIADSAHRLQEILAIYQ